MAGPTFEVKGGRVTHSYLMNKSKFDIACLAMEYLRESERNRAKRREYFARYALDVIEQASDDPMVGGRDKLQETRNLIGEGKFHDAAEEMRGRFSWTTTRAGFGYWSNICEEMRAEGNYV